MHRALWPILAAFLLAAPAPAAAQSKPATGPPRVLLLLVPPSRYLNPPAPPQTPGAVKPPPKPSPPSLLQELAARPALKGLGIVGATQGKYNEQQALLDIAQGTRVSQATYDPKQPPPLLLAGPTGSAHVVYWPQVLARADTAPGDIRPGLLAGSIPGGAGFVGAGHHVSEYAALAVDRTGRVSATSVGRGRTLTARIAAMLTRKRFVVAVLPHNHLGYLDALLARRAPSDLILVMKAPPFTDPDKSLPPQLLALGAAGLSVNDGALTSDSTRRAGLVAAIDIAPTILKHLGIKTSSAIKGQSISVSGTRDAGELQSFYNRLRVTTTRRFAVIVTFLLVWLGVICLLALISDRRGLRMGMRVGGLAALWTPSAILVAALLRPSRPLELAVVVGGSFIAGLVTDRFARWPRGPAVPAVVTLVAYAIDLANGSALINESLIGANPLFGSRFYGIGNELEAALPVLAFAGLAAVIPARSRRRSDAALFAFIGLALGLIVGSGRLGADVGGVITVAGGTVVATLLMLPGRRSWRSVVAVIAIPVLAVGVLALLDLATGGNGHFTRDVLHANRISDLLDTVRRRYSLAWNVLRHGLMPIDIAISLLAAACGIRYRERIFATVAGAPAWQAAMAGGLAAGVGGALSNDSGPLLLLIAVFGLACVTIYLRGDPRLADLEPPFVAGLGQPKAA